MRRSADDKTPQERAEDERHWKVLLERVDAGICTPFIGAGACFGSLPLGADVAGLWAKFNNFPLDNPHDLARVAQFVAIEDKDWSSPKRKILQLFKAIGTWPAVSDNAAARAGFMSQVFDQQAPGDVFVGLQPDEAAAWNKDLVADLNRLFESLAAPSLVNRDDPHSLLADLPLPVYVTTNYDDFMVRALRARGKQPRREVCRWNKLLQKRLPRLKPGFAPTPEQPLVFHLHGSDEDPESLVLTEDDYLDFLVNWSPEDKEMVPARVQGAMAGTSLLFVGYSIADWDFRVLYRSLVGYLESSTKKTHVSVQLEPGHTVAPELRKEQRKRYLRAQEYLEKYFGKLDIQVYWGTCQEFVAEFRERWEAFKGKPAGKLAQAL